MRRKDLRLQRKIDSRRKFLYILFRWREWSEDDEFEKYIKEITERDEDFLDFIDKFEHETRSHTAGDRGVRIHKRFNFKNLSEFCDLEEVKARIENIVLDQSLYNKHKSAIDLFLKYFDKRNSDLIFDWDE